MPDESKSKRLRERVALALPVRVKCRETATHEWSEVTRLIDASPFGVRFALKHATEVGRLLHLTMPLPRPFRSFDFVEDQYRIWCVVRNVRRATGVQAQASANFEVGAAFVGKQPPQSYLDDPATRYDVVFSNGKAIELSPRKTGRGARSQESRLTLPVEVTLEIFDERGDVSQSEQTVTVNLSRRGAAVYTSLAVERGRFVRLTSARHDASLIAAVRGRREEMGGVALLHLEFVGGEWRLEGLS